MVESSCLFSSPGLHGYAKDATTPAGSSKGPVGGQELTAGRAPASPRFPPGMIVHLGTFLFGDGGLAVGKLCRDSCLGFALRRLRPDVPVAMETRSLGGPSDTK